MLSGIGTRQKQSGLTLVEIAIVLVILGLLVGGVLKSREMMTKARIKRVETDCAQFAAAVSAYKDRYGALPGDDPAASVRFEGVWRGSDNGNGDGSISGSWGSNSNSHETRKIWKHLRGAGLIDGPVDTSDASYQQPRNPFGGTTGFGIDVYNLPGLSIVFGEIPGDVAQIFEARSDDGVPSRGSIQAHVSQTSYDVDLRYDVAFRP